MGPPPPLTSTSTHLRALVSSTGWRFKVRPGADYFLQTVGYPNFEFVRFPDCLSACQGAGNGLQVVFTSESGMTAAPIVEALNKGEARIFMGLYRDTTKWHRGHHVKVRLPVLY